MSKSRCEYPGISKSPSIARIEAQALRRQQIAFCVLTGSLIAALLLLHSYFSTLLGEPSKSVIVILAAAFLVKVLEWVWLWRQKNGINERVARICGIGSRSLLISAGNGIAPHHDEELVSASASKEATGEWRMTCLQ